MKVKKWRRYLLLILTAIAIITLVAYIFSKSTTATNAEIDGEFRIIPTTVALTDTMDALDLDIVGKPTTSKELPERYADVPEIGSSHSPDAEIVMSLTPTHVLSVTTLKSEMDFFYEKVDMNPIYYDYDSVEGMLDSITEMGETFDRKKEAKTLVDSIQEVVDQAKEKAEQQTNKPTVLILMGLPGSYQVCTSTSYIGDLVEIVGAENVITDTSASYLESNTEYLNSVNPDIILRLSHAYPTQVKEMFDEEFANNQIWSTFSAVQNGKVYDLDEEPFGITANIDAGDAIKQLYELIYGVSWDA